MKPNPSPTGAAPTSGSLQDTLSRRLAAARAALEQETGLTPEVQQGILLARAQALAQCPVSPVGPSDTLTIVAFRLAHEHYGIETAAVREVLPLQALTPLPGTPPFVLGIINVRGEILSVLDLKKFFDLPERGLTDLNTVIVLQSEKMTFGILADAIFDVRTVSRQTLQPPLPTLTGIRAEYLKGITPERMVILDAERLLSDSTIVVCDTTE
jgi:purine-binding chemotaxis protein CheW